MIKRVVIFAGYNRKPEIEDYVLYYLKGLSEISNDIIYVADNANLDRYRQQLSYITKHCILEKHGEYDFGSWKRGLRFALGNGILEDADELILCNDSCYGPIFSFKDMFENMDTKTCDFWGITQNCKFLYHHLQSYFLVFRKNIFNSRLFIDFFEQVTTQKCFWDIVTAYEVGLSQLLLEKGKFHAEVYCPINSGRHNPATLATYLLKAKSPLIKRKIFTQAGFSRQSKIFLLLKMPNHQIQYFMKKDYWSFFLVRIWQMLKRFVYQSKNTKSGHKIIKICKIPFICVKNEQQI